MSGDDMISRGGRDQPPESGGGREVDAVPDGSRFASQGEAKAELLEAFNDWSATLTGRSIATALGAIGVNWAVYGSTNTILSNDFALWSVGVAIGFLGFDLFATAIMVELLRSNLNEAGIGSESWVRRWEDRLSDEYFPYTRTIDWLGVLSRVVKVLAPVVAVVLFLISLFVTDSMG